MSEWDNLTETELAAVRRAFETSEAQRQAFTAWEAKQGAPATKQYRNMTEGERIAFLRQNRIPVPHRGLRK